MRKLTFVFALVSFMRPVYGQFQNLATNDDGSVLYASSLLLLDGMAVTTRPELRVYSVAPAVAVAVERAANRRPTGRWGSGDGADLVQLSGDGQIIGYTLRRICEPDAQPCLQSKVIGEIRRGAQVTVLGEGTLRLSRNGRWGLLDPGQAPPQEPARQGTLIDLTTGERHSTPLPLFGALSPLASDGTILVESAVRGQTPALWRNGTLTPLMIEGNIRPLALSDNAQVLLYNDLQFASSSGPISLRLRARNLTSGRDTLIYESVATSIWITVGSTLFLRSTSRALRPSISIREACSCRERRAWSRLNLVSPACSDSSSSRVTSAAM